MILYSRFNCRQAIIEKIDTPRISGKDRSRAARRMDGLRFDAGWLRRRMCLFMAFTYPSVLAQTHQGFRWLVLVHPDSPDWLIGQLRALDRLEVCLTEWDTEAAVRGTKSINLDTDDAIAKNFMEIASTVDFEGETVPYRGMRYRILTNVWISTCSSNAHFGIIRHPTDTVLDHSHGMGVLPKNIVDVKLPLWLEVIHEENISNKLIKPRESRDVGYQIAAKYFGMASKEEVSKLCTIRHTPE